MAEVIELFEDDDLPHTNFFGRYTERELIGLLESMINDAEDFLDSEVNPQREKNLEYYYGEPLGNEKKGRSRHISMDVLDAVEGAKAILLEAFGGTNQAVVFEACASMSEPMAKAATSYVQDSFFRKNTGYQLIRDGVHDGLVSKTAIYCAEWAELEDEVIHAIPPTPVQQLAPLAGNPQVEVRVEEIMPGVVAGNLVEYKDKSSVKVSLIPPEKFGADPEATCLKTARYLFDWEDRTQSELLEMGFDEDLVLDLTPTDDTWGESEGVESARASVDSTFGYGESYYNEENQLYRIYRVYVYLDLEDDGRADLYEIYLSSGRMLADPAQVDEHPYFIWSAIPLSHRWIGLAQADTVRPIQKSKSVLQRLIIDNQHRVNTSRSLANYGLIKNPRELVDNHIGGVVQTSDINNSVRELPTPALSPATFNVLEMMDRELEGRSGVSRLSQGLNQDALSSQNSDRMIQRMANASNRRIMLMARDLAETCLKPLYRRILALGIEHEKKPVQILMGGQWQPVQLSQFDAETPLKVAVALTEQERQARALWLLSMHTQMTQDQSLAPIYALEQKQALLGEVFRLMGETAFDQYLQDPSSKQFQQKMAQQAKLAQQQKQQQDQLQGALIQAQVIQAQAQASKVQAEASKAKGTLALDQGELQRKIDADQVKAHDTGVDNLQARREQTHKELIDWAKLRQ